MKFTDNFPMSQITTLGIGGPAKKFVSVKSEEELVEAIKYAEQNNLEYLVIGGGSNLLVSDQGVDKLIIKNEIARISHLGGVIKVKSGTLLQNLVDYSISHGLSGIEKLTGIPGTVGGAIYGNAGAYGQTISDHITSVVILGRSETTTPESIDSGQARVTFGKDACEFNYRDSIFKKNKLPILEVTFELESGDTKTLQQEADDVLQKRLVKYPKGIKCPGSFFKNIVAETLPSEILEKISPEKIVYGKLPAGTLLEEVGAKGDKLDGIEIAPYHANLFINRGSGTAQAQAFYTLAQKYVKKVKEKYGITLEPEVQLINLPTL